MKSLLILSLFSVSNGGKLFWSPPISFQPLWTLSSDCGEKTVYDDGLMRFPPPAPEGKCFSQEKFLCSLDKNTMIVSDDLVFGTRWTVDGKMQCLYNVYGFQSPEMMENYISLFGLERSWASDAAADVSTKLGISEAIENVCSVKVKDSACLLKYKKENCPIIMSSDYKGNLCRRIVSYGIHQLGDPLFMERMLSKKNNK